MLLLTRTPAIGTATLCVSTLSARQLPLGSFCRIYTKTPIKRNGRVPNQVCIKHFCNANASRQFVTLGTAGTWLILIGRTQRSLRVVQLTSVLFLLFASASGGDRQDPSKNPTQRRPLPTE